LASNTFTKITEPANGTITAWNTADGTFTFEPATGFIGITTFKYNVCDVNGMCSETTVKITVHPPTIVHLTPVLSKINEGGKITITAELENSIPEDYLINLRYDLRNASTSDAASPNDYVLSGNHITMMIKAGETTTQDHVIVTGFKDGIKENDENFFVNIQTPSTSDLVEIGKNAEVIIHDMFPTNEPPSGKDENPDIRPDPMTSPNGDDRGNEEFFIYNITAYPDNEVAIFNRWGNEVFRVKNYDNQGNAFRGKANRGILTNTQEDLVDGVYYYLIYTKVNGVQKINKGYIILKRKK
jgi:hypothetical protein